VTPHNLTEHARALAAYLPNGKTFEAKNLAGSNFNQLLRGLAGELFTAEGYLITLEREYFPDATVLFLDEWEQALGIPDACFSGTGTLNERRRDILVKLASLGVQTADDFVELGAVFGVTVTITPGVEAGSFPMTFPFVLFGSPSEARFTIFVTLSGVDISTFPYTFPILFGSTEIGVLECLFKRLAPDNCNVVFKQV
jgi:uncharacterized protein YmfQ (DUF2313 family)